MNVVQGTTAETLVPKLGNPEILLACWRCGSPLRPIASVPENGTGMYACQSCDAACECRDGIWIALAPQRAEHFARFVTDYEFIREAEGRGSRNDDYYLALPYQDTTGTNSDQWKIRARTFDFMKRRLLAPLASSRKGPLRILDLGAGNGWMSYRLAQFGHAPVAVDLLVNERDGLGAARHFQQAVKPLFPRVQAELDHLPFANATFDLAIFNASFHYSENYERTFAEAVRCVRPDGAVVIADTPWYANEETGERMVTEKRAYFTAKHGFPSSSIASREYLTPTRLFDLWERIDARWEVFKPFYGLRWSLRPLRAKLLNRRPPSEFRVYAAWVNK